MLVGCIIYTEQLIILSAILNDLQALLNCCHTVMLRFILKLFSAIHQHTCIAIGSGNFINVQLDNKYQNYGVYIHFKYLTSDGARNLLVDADIVRRKLVI